MTIPLIPLREDDSVVRVFRQSSDDRRSSEIVTVDGRQFEVKNGGDYSSFFVAFMYPRPRHTRRPLADVLTRTSRSNQQTEMRFKVFTTKHGRLGYITNVTVASARRRQGWATSMVHVLLELYPDCIWSVESPNEQSGQLFVHLARDHPGRILPPLIDTTYDESDRERYDTLPLHEF